MLDSIIHCGIVNEVVLKGWLVMDKDDGHDLTLRARIRRVLLAPNWRLFNGEDRVILTFREKLGFILMWPAVAAWLLAVLIVIPMWLVIWWNNAYCEVNFAKLLTILIFGGIALVRLSYYTVKK